MRSPPDSAVWIAATQASWTDLQAEFMRYAAEHSDLSAVWRWMYPAAVMHEAIATAVSVGPDFTPYEALRQMYQRPDLSARPPAPKGQWTLEGGSPLSQDLFRVIAGRAASSKFPDLSGAEPWRLWLDSMRAEGYATEIPAVGKTGELLGRYPRGFEDRHIEHVFKVSADFCLARSIAEAHETFSPAGRLDQAALPKTDAVVCLRKPNGTVIEGLRAQLSGKAILILDSSNPIEKGDVLIRSLSNGLRMGFIVDDPGYREALGSIPAHFAVRVHRAAPIDSLESSGFWRERRAEFEQLADQQHQALGVNPEHPRWLRGACSRLESAKLAFCEVDGGLDSQVRSKFDDVATQAAMALGCSSGDRSVEFWTSCVCLDLLQNWPEAAAREIWQSLPEAGSFTTSSGRPRRTAPGLQ